MSRRAMPCGTGPVATTTAESGIPREFGKIRKSPEEFLFGILENFSILIIPRNSVMMFQLRFSVIQNLRTGQKSD
jgi:hypothetical protein